MSLNLDKASAKILVLGDSGVGKSSLIHLICHGSVLSSAQWTIGCAIDVKLYEDYFLEFWDIGGSRSHKIARSFLYQDYHGIMLVFDATNKKSRDNLNAWLAEVTQKANDKDLETFVNKNVPVIKIATKKDLLPHGSVLESDSKNPNCYNDEHCSVVNFSESPQASYPYQRRQQSLSPLLSKFNSFSSTTSLSSHSSSRNSHSDEALIGNQELFVNTQDVLSFSDGSKNYERLSSFFKQVIERRNKKFYNKFAI